MLLSKSMLAVPCLPLPMSPRAGFCRSVDPNRTCQKRHSQTPFRDLVRKDTREGSVPWRLWGCSGAWFEGLHRSSLRVSYRPGRIERRRWWHRCAAPAWRGSRTVGRPLGGQWPGSSHTVVFLIAGPSAWVGGQICRNLQSTQADQRAGGCCKVRTRRPQVASQAAFPCIRERALFILYERCAARSTALAV